VRDQINAFFRDPETNDLSADLGALREVSASLLDAAEPFTRTLHYPSYAKLFHDQLISTCDRIEQTLGLHEGGDKRQARASAGFAIRSLASSVSLVESLRVTLKRWPRLSPGTPPLIMQDGPHCEVPERSTAMPQQSATEETKEFPTKKKKPRGRTKGVNKTTEAIIVLSQRLKDGESLQIADIAKQVGCHRKTLKQSKRFMNAYHSLVGAYTREAKYRGYKKDGCLDAWEDSRDDT
jgi:hypothetical protein